MENSEFSLYQAGNVYKVGHFKLIVLQEVELKSSARDNQWQCFDLERYLYSRNYFPGHLILNILAVLLNEAE